MPYRRALLALCLAFAACSYSDAVDADAGVPYGADGRFRAVFITDTHIAGPEYVCCSESNDSDNHSILQTEARLREVVRRINAIQPAPEVVFILGDVLHNPYYSTERAYYDEHDTAFPHLHDILEELRMPYYMALGNHDYDISCDGGAYVSREFTHGLFRDLLGTDPYQAVDYKGWRFVLMNSMLGRSWEPTDPACDTEYGSYGTDQLAWIDEQLSGGLPTTVMAHYPLPFTMVDEDPAGPNPDLLAVLASHASDNLMLSLAGHMHLWLDFSGSYTFPAAGLAGTRYDTDNFWEIEFDPANRSFRLLDEDKGRHASYCADTWSYDGDPTYLLDQPAEDGDCRF